METDAARGMITTEKVDGVWQTTLTSHLTGVQLDYLYGDNEQEAKENHARMVQRFGKRRT